VELLVERCCIELALVIDGDGDWVNICDPAKSLAENVPLGFSHNRLANTGAFADAVAMTRKRRTLPIFMGQPVVYRTSDSRL
jgi:hypothetical protein